MLRKRVIQEKDRVTMLRQTIAQQLIEARENLANADDQILVERRDSHECKICIGNTTVLMCCENCGFGTCVNCHERRTSITCYFCNVTTSFNKCRLD
jgi:uncharacterized ferredoxin-like protein